MIIEGLKLMLLGMGVVFTFLILLYYAVSALGIILQPYTQKELALLVAARQKERLPKPASGKQMDADNGNLIAVISAAVAAHRNRE